MEHERELSCDDLATSRRRPPEIAGTGLEGTPFESTRVHNKEGGDPQMPYVGPARRRAYGAAGKRRQRA